MHKDKVIVNSAIGKWYPKGQDRLIKSLDEVGYTGDRLMFRNNPINEFYDPSNPYTTKTASLFEALREGCRYILWVDCSIWAVQNIEGFFDIIKNDGYYFMRSGHNCSQTTNDHACKVSGFTHDELEKLPELWSCIFGFDTQHEQGKKVLELFIEYSLKGVFNGDRTFNRAECSDHRFKFSRQDQTALSLAVHKVGITNIHHPNIHILQDAEGKPNNENTYFRMRGM